MTDLRAEFSPQERATPVTYTIDPGFVNHRRVQSILGPKLMRIVDAQVRSVPNSQDWEAKVRVDHILTRSLLDWCGPREVKPLAEALANSGDVYFCSRETLAPWEPLDKEGKRLCSRWQPVGSPGIKVEFHYSAGHVHADTLRWQLEIGTCVSSIGEIVSRDGEVVVCHPIVMGWPMVQAGDAELDAHLHFYRDRFYQSFIEDFDEFAEVSKVPEPPDPLPMEHVYESAFKACLAKILGDSVPPDWGGERSDFFSAHLHLRGRRVTASFLLKGPARFAPMRLSHLGKNNDQILRLSHEPADVLVVQHCHDILPEERETLHVFAVQPCKPRRYCLIDGRDSLRLLNAYGLYDEAVRLSARK